jgi:hypothetical protein
MMVMPKEETPERDLSKQLEVLGDYLEAQDAPLAVFEALEAIEEALQDQLRITSRRADENSHHEWP